MDMSCSHTERTERARFTESQRIIQETDCGCVVGGFESRDSKCCNFDKSAIALSSYR